MSHSALNAHFLAFIGKACQSLLYRTAFGTFLGQLSCIFFPVLVCSELVWILSPLSILFHQLYVGWSWTENVDVIIFILISLGSTEGGLSREWEGRAGLNWPSTGRRRPLLLISEDVCMQVSTFLLPLCSAPLPPYCHEGSLKSLAEISGKSFCSHACGAGPTEVVWHIISHIRPWCLVVP